MTSSDVLEAPTGRADPAFPLFSLLGRLSESRGWAYFLIIPSLILIMVVVIYPVISGILMSFQELRLTRPGSNGYIGFEHYIDLVSDRIFLRALQNTVVWVIGGVTSQFLLGLITALALNRGIFGSRLARIVVLLPWILPTVAAGHMWALMLDPRLGVINDILVRLGFLDSYRAWFADPSTAMPAVLVVALWQGFPFFTLMLLAGMQGIPDDLYEAASVDGANPLQEFIHITLPLLRPIIVSTVVLRVIGLVNAPDLLIILTNGGPGDATQMLSLYAFNKAYASFDFGYAGAISVVMFIILMVFTIVYVRALRATQE
ncbi:MAG: sugar ABC transporter permease [Anaerolineae bacterium]|nr:sugar ABC transporter permease [Anaerolineae bacterium]